MEIAYSIRDVRSMVLGKTIGFVPTMGFLHEGHASLIRRAKAENDVAVVSVFVNPSQFTEGEDLEKYPRDLPRDMAVAMGAGADVLFTPSPQEIYPEGFCTTVHVAGPALPLEGHSRPEHFVGVATVVLKLLNIVQPHKAYFGEKDYQQLQVIRRLVTDLNLSAEVIGCITRRERTGLAMSSRNSYFSEEQKSRASVLARSLLAAKNAYKVPETTALQVLEAARDVLATEPDLNVDYLTLVDEHLQPCTDLSRPENIRLLVAASLFGVRLIDNMGLI